ncbi:hypothetical protein [Metapseudomonas otitidis]|uniref:hypothetical protein n=1 Tax=Metapseudomonas otitidis TaxID=319939 RepID=UPI0013F65746|nr:hypothetical protein [Pseudomonas otitidis]
MPDTASRAPGLALLPGGLRPSAHPALDGAPVNDGIRFPSLEDFPDEVLDVHRGSPPEACRDLGNYRLVQATHLVQRIRDEFEAAGEPHAERLLSGLEALLVDAYLMFARSQIDRGSAEEPTV